MLERNWAVHDCWDETGQSLKFGTKPASPRRGRGPTTIRRFLKSFSTSHLASKNHRCGNNLYRYYDMATPCSAFVWMSFLLIACGGCLRRPCASPTMPASAPFIVRRRLQSSFPTTLFTTSVTIAENEPDMMVFFTAVATFTPSSYSDMLACEPPLKAKKPNISMNPPSAAN